MSFQAFVDRTAPTGEVAARFDHCDEKLPVFDNPTPEQKVEILAKAREIAAAIGAGFDRDAAEQTPQIQSLFDEMNRFWQAPAPWGMLPTPPPVQLFQQLVGALQHWLSTCHSYDHDALKLAKAGAPEFKNYLQQFIDDSSGALDKLNNSPTSVLSGSPASFGAPPGPNFAPPGPMPPPHFGQPYPFGGPSPFGGPNPYGSPMPFGGPSPYGGPSPVGTSMPLPSGYPPAPYFPFGGMPPGMMPPAFPHPGGGPPPGMMHPAAPASLPPDAMKEAMKFQADVMAQVHRDQQKSFDETNKKFDDYLKS